MKAILLITLMISTFINTAIIKDPQKNNQINDTPKRKLSNSPYLNAFDDFSAKPLGIDDNQAQTSLAATSAGESPASINAALPLNGGASTNPYLATMPHPMMGAYMNPMMHLGNPMLNPMHPGNPISPLNPINQTLAASAIIHGGRNLHNNIYSSGQKCEGVQQEAIRIANRLMKKQNKLIYKEIMNYMLKSKFLVGLTEVKLNAALRKKITMLMSQYNELTPDNIQFVRSSLDDTEDSIIDSSNFQEADNSLDEVLKDFE